MGQAGTGLHEARLHSGHGSLVGSGMLLALASPRVGVVVYPRVSAGEISCVRKQKTAFASTRRTESARPSERIALCSRERCRREASRPCGFGCGESGAPGGGRPCRREGTCRAWEDPVGAPLTVAGRFGAVEP